MTETPQRCGTHGEEVAPEDDLHDQPCRLGWILRGAHEDSRTGTVTDVEEMSAKSWVRASHPRVSARAEHGSAMQESVASSRHLTECSSGTQQLGTVLTVGKLIAWRCVSDHPTPTLCLCFRQLIHYLFTSISTTLSLTPPPCPLIRTSSSLWASTQPG
jgi:hypothetical protein